MSASDNGHSDELVLDLSDITVDEICAFEDLADVPFDEAFVAGQKKGPTLRALATIIKRRENPDFSVVAAGKLKISLTGEDVADPTVPAGNAG